MFRYNKTVTVFNQYTSDDDVLGSEHWFPTVLEGVLLKETQGANITRTGLMDANSVTMHIKTEGYEKPYMDPVEWGLLLDKTDAFTLCRERDFFVVGDVSDVEVRDNFFAYMKENYDGVYRIMTVDKYETIPHYEIGGK